MKRTLFIVAITAILTTACSESLEDRAAREAKEYTEKFCPTPVQQFERTDSITFDKPTKTYTFYRTLCGDADNEEVIREQRKVLDKAIKDGIRNNTSLKVYKTAKFNFRLVYHSESNPKKVLLEYLLTPKDYLSKDVK